MRYATALQEGLPMRLSTIAAAATVGGALLVTAPNVSSAQVSGGEVALRPKALVLRESMRELLADHVIYNREYVVLSVAGDPSASATATRLMRNQDDIGRAVAVYYGDAAGSKLTQLLKV